MKPTSLFANKSLIFIMITTFLSVIGIGIIIPEVPFIVARYMPGATEAQIALNVGLLTSIYSVCQFFAAPGLGALSDKYGRRPVLLFCLLGSALGYIMFGVGGALWILFVGRIIDGLTGGDISTIFAYIADVTKPEDRGRTFGVIGAIAGIGFMVGPTVGGLLSIINLSLPFYVAAVVILLNALFGYFVLPESLKPEHRMVDFSWHHLNPFALLQSVLSGVMIRTILLIGFFYFLPFAQLQGIGGVFTKDVLHWQPASLGIYFFIVGLVDIVTQGYLSGKFLKRFGELKLVLAGLAVTGIAYLLNASLVLFPYTLFAYFGVVVFAFGGGLIEPALGSLISKLAGPREQGRVQGANQSLQSITRIIGPLLGAYLYGMHASLPYLVCAFLSGVAIIYTFSQREKIREHLRAPARI